MSEASGHHDGAPGTGADPGGIGPPSELGERLAQFERDILAEVDRQRARADAAEARLAALEGTGSSEGERARDLVADAERRADEIVAAAERDAERVREEALQSRRQMLETLGEHVAELGEAYRQAIDEARRIVRRYAPAPAPVHPDERRGARVDNGSSQSPTTEPP